MLKILSWRYLLLCLVLAVLLFAPPREFEPPIFLALNHFFSLLPSLFWLGVTAIATISAVWILPLTALRPRLFALFTLTGLVATGFTYLFKYLAGRGLLRPPALLDPSTFQIIGEVLSRSSMPSGHTVSGFLLALWCIEVWPQKQTWFFALGSLIALSRIACGVHWPTDVIAGAILALLSFYLVKSIYVTLEERARQAHWPVWLGRASVIVLGVVYLTILVFFFKNQAVSNQAPNTEEWMARGYAAIAFLSGIVIVYFRQLRRDCSCSLREGP